MKASFRLAVLLLPLLILFVVDPVQRTEAWQVSISPTPTYDPLVEPPLPENPTEYEIGQNLYWHWCMTCHGDRGQGLTDEFRAIWEPEHQDCWGRGCHAGRVGDEGFPIPTVVPAIVNDVHLAQFGTVQDLTGFLQETHPPQSPGVLKGEEYHAIALFVFSMNERPLADFIAAETRTPTLAATPVTEQKNTSSSIPIYAIVILSALAAGVLVLARRVRLQK